MSDDLAVLGLGVDSKPVAKASDDLGRFTKSAQEAEQGANKLGNSSRRMNQQLDQLGGSLNGLRSILTWIGGFVGFTSLAMTVKAAVDRISEAERRAARLQSVLETTGRSQYTSVAQVREFADEMERTTGVAADEVVAAAARLATFETITGDAFQKAIKAALDFSEVYGGTLATNIEAIARALEDPVQGMVMLQRQGFKLTEEQKRLVKQMVQVGDVAGWQKVIFDQIAGTTGAAANAYTGLRREVSQAALAFEKFMEALVSASGGTTGAQTALSTLTGALVYLTNNMDLVLGVISGVTTLVALRFIPTIIAATTAVTGFTIALMRNPLGLLVAGIATAITYLVAFRNETVSVLGITTSGGQLLNAVWVTMINSVKTVFTWVSGFYEVLKKIVTFDWSGIGSVMEQIGQRMVGLARETKAAWADAFKTILPETDGWNFNAFRANTVPAPPATATPQVSEEYRKLIAQAERRSAQLRTEIQLVHMAGAAAASFKFEQDLLARAAEQNIILSGKQKERIKELATEYGRLAEQLARTKLHDDLMFERDQLGRSAIDARIASQLRGAGLDVDFTSYEAGLIRINEQLKLSKDIASDFAGTFASEFRSAIKEGENFWDSFSRAGLKALERLGDKLMDMAVQDLVGKAFGGSSGFNIFSMFGGATGAPSGGLGSIPNPFAWQFHKGGVVGVNGAMRYVHPAYFENAQRYHSGGLVGGEVPAVLQRGEEVLRRDDPRHRYNGGGGSQSSAPVINIDARGAQKGVGEEISAALNRFVRSQQFEIGVSRASKRNSDALVK